jgi:hypothetical protein
MKNTAGFFQSNRLWGRFVRDVCNSGDIHDKYCQGKNNIVPWPSPKPPVAFQLAKSDLVTLLRYVIFVPCLCQKEWDLLARHPFAASGYIPNRDDRRRRLHWGYPPALKHLNGASWLLTDHSVTRTARNGGKIRCSATL